MKNWKEDRVVSAESGENPTVLRQLRSGYAVIGDVQFLPGYCVLLRCPQVPSLNYLSRRDRMEFLADMVIVGEAIERVLKPENILRVNYEILGNSDTFLHVHLWPRYEWEEEERKTKPVWLYPESMWIDEQYQLSERHDDLRAALGEAIDSLVTQSGS